MVIFGQKHIYKDEGIQLLALRGTWTKQKKEEIKEKGMFLIPVSAPLARNYCAF